MDPVEPGPWLSARPKQLILLSGLDFANRPTHKALLDAFQTRTPDQPPFKVKVMTTDFDLSPKVSSDKSVSGIIRKEWPQKYLDQVPALVVHFMDLNWDDPSWSERVLEVGSKTESLRKNLQHGSKLAFVLLQNKSTMQPENEDRAADLCQKCQLSPKQLFIVPTSGDLRNFVSKLDNAFHEIAMSFYQDKIKTIRSRSIPHNASDLLVRQFFKLGFLSELRLDTHTALRNYKLAYDRCVSEQSQWQASDVFEWRTVAGLINYKICELFMLHSTPVDAINQMKKHQNAFFNADAGSYPTRALSEIEFELWKSKQCWHFADLFERAVRNGLAGVAAMNPGTFLEYAAHYFMSANKKIRELKRSLPRDSRYPDPDPLLLPTRFFGQRPWRAHLLDPQAQEAIREAAVVALQIRLVENHEGLLSLLSGTAAQYGRYRCRRLLVNIVLLTAEAHEFAYDFTAAGELLLDVLRDNSLPPNREAYVAASALRMACYSANLDHAIWLLLFHLSTQKNSATSLKENAYATLQSIIKREPPSNFAFLADSNVSPAFAPLLGDVASHTNVKVTRAWQDVFRSNGPRHVLFSRNQGCVELSARFLNCGSVVKTKPVHILVEVTQNTIYELPFNELTVYVRSSSQEDSNAITASLHNISLVPLKKKNFVLCVNLLDSNMEFSYGSRIFIDTISLKLGDYIYCDWKITAESLSIAQFDGSITDTGVTKVTCLLAEIAEARFEFQNNIEQDVSNVRLISKRTQGSAEASSVLFVDEYEQLKPELSQTIADSLQSGEKIEAIVKFSSQLQGPANLPLELVCSLPGSQEEYRRDVSLLVESRDPFIVRSQILTINGIPITTALNRSDHLLKVDIKSNADIEITRIAWMLADVVTPSSARVADTIFKVPDILSPDDVVTYCTEINILSEEESDDEVPLGRLAVYWRRVGSDSPVRSIVPLFRPRITKCPISISVNTSTSVAQMRKPIELKYSLTNNTDDAIELSAAFDLADTFMFGGNKFQNITLLPGIPHEITISAIALTGGRLPFPRVTLKSPTVPEAVILDCMRNLPATIFVLPLSKGL